MKKYIAEVRKPCPFHSASDQARNWDETMEMKIFISDEGRVFTKTPSYATPHSRNCCAVSSDKWKAKGDYAFRYTSVDQWLNKIGAVESNYRGQPRMK